MKEMIGYCGLDCKKCDAYLATVHDDQALREKTAKLWAGLNTPPFCRNISTARVVVRTERKRYFASICVKSGNVLWKRKFPLAATARI